jgi:hypothetical protein
VGARVAERRQRLDPSQNRGRAVRARVPARVLQDAEAAEIAARSAYQMVRGAQKQRTQRIKTQRDELTRAEGAIRSAGKLDEREQAQRDELIVV